jgi:uncharacterized protein RhaS with RHS repeats
LSADPAGTVDGLNLYRMVRNNPLTLRDPDGRMPKHPAEIRLSENLAEILKRAEAQIEGAINALKPKGILGKKIPEKSLTLVQDFMGNSKKETIIELNATFNEMKKGLSRFSVKDFNVAEELVESGDNTTAYIRAPEILKFQKGGRASIYISYMSVGRWHLENIANTVVHEVSHLTSKSEDYQYGQLTKVKGQFDAALLYPLLNYAESSQNRAIKNAESLARLAELLHYSCSNNEEHILLINKYFESKKASDISARGVIAYHRLSQGDSPRISTPDMSRRNQNDTRLRKIGNHLVI